MLIKCIVQADIIAEISVILPMAVILAMKCTCSTRYKNILFILFNICAYNIQICVYNSVLVHSYWKLTESATGERRSEKRNMDQEGMRERERKIKKNRRGITNKREKRMREE